MRGLGIKAARVAIVVALFAIWEILSRTGIVNPRLLPSASDTLAMLGELLQRAERAQGSRGHRERGGDRVRARRAGRRADRLPDRGEPLLCRRGKAAAVLCLQHSEIDLPADVHPGVRRRLCAEGRLRLLLDHLHRDHVDHDGGGVGQGRASDWSRAPTARRRCRPRFASICRACCRCCWRRCGSR